MMNYRAPHRSALRRSISALRFAVKSCFAAAWNCAGESNWSERNSSMFWTFSR